jgi:Secretion system C-terminal sorting domain
MKKNYFYSVVLFFSLFSLSGTAQEIKPAKAHETSIDGLNFYPNPVSNGKIYITSKSAADKEVTIFDVLGKKVLQVSLSNAKELNIASVSPGIYIIKFREGEATETRKLIVK